MNKLADFKFNEPYEGKEIDKINHVPFPKEYLEFMRRHNGGEKE